MESPGYRWTCHKCERANDPEAVACAACGFPAVSTARDIAAAKQERSPTAEGYKAVGKGTGWIAYFLGIFMS